MPEITSTSKPRSKGLLIWLILSQILAIALLVIWLGVGGVAALGISAMAFDAGETPQAWAFVIALWCWPLIPIMTAIGAWIAYARRKNTSSAVLSALTLVIPIVPFIGLWLVMR